MKIPKTAVMILILLICGVAHLVGVANPDVYNPTFNQNPPYGTNLADIKYELDELNETVELGQVQILLTTYYYDNQNEWNGNYTLVISSPFPELRLTHIEDSSKYFTGTMTVKIGSAVQGTFSDFIFPDNRTTEYVASKEEQPLYKYFLSLDPFTILDDTEYEGTYSFPFNVSIWVDYTENGPDENSVMIGSKDYTLLMKYVNPSDGSTNGSVFTNLAVYPYSTAEDINIPNLEMTNGRLTVGAVHFMSDDKKTNSDYRIRISPGEDPDNVTAQFAFHKLNSNSIIPYKVRPKLSEFASAEDKQFFVYVQDQGLAGVWEKFFELEISDINYLDYRYTVGDYTSLIQIQLIKN